MHQSVMNPKETYNKSDKYKPTTPIESNQKEQLWSATFILVIFLTFVGFLVNQGLNTGSSVYLSYVGETAALAGIGAAVFSVSGGLTRMFGGNAIDQKGRAKCTIVGMGILVVFTIAPMINYTGISFIFLRFMQGIGFGMATTAVATAAADVLPLSRLNEGIGYSGLGQALAMSMGPALGLTLVASDPHTNLFLGLFFFAILGFASAFLLRYEKKPWILPKDSTYRKRWEEMKQANAASVALDVKDASIKSEATQQSSNSVSATEKLDDRSKPKGLRKYLEPSAIPGAVPLLIFSPSMGFLIYFGGLLGESVGVGNVGMFFTLSAITMIIIRLSSKAFMNTVPPIIIMGIATIGALVAYAILIAISLGVFGVNSRIMFFVAGIPYGLATGLASPLNQAVAVSNSSAERWGAANATFLIAFDIGIGISCILWGILSDLFGFTFVMCCIIVFIVCSWIAAFFLYPKKNKAA